MTNIGSAIRDAIDRALPPLVNEKVRQLAFSLQNAIQREANDARMAGLLKAADALDQVVVEPNFKSINDCSLSIKSNYLNDPEIGDDVKSGIYVGRQYVFG